MLSRLSAAIFVALASAACTISVAPSAAQAMSTSRYFPEAAILDWSGQRFTIIRIDSLDRYSDEWERLNAWIDANPARVEALQHAVLENRELASALRARSVQLNNVGAIEQALNGNLVVYLR